MQLNIAVYVNHFQAVWSNGSWLFHFCNPAYCPGGVLGWVSDRDAQHRRLTQNATKGEKGGSKLYILPNFAQK